jgi:hypothetical protein
MRNPQISGWCGNLSTLNPTDSHERCQRMGHGNRFNPLKEFAPCPCACHLGEERYECSECGGILAEAPWPDEEAEANKTEPEPIYTHVDPETGRATGFECNGRKRRTPVYENTGDNEAGAPDEEDDFSDLGEDEGIFAGLVDEGRYPNGYGAGESGVVSGNEDDWSEPDLDEDEPDYAEMEDDFPDLEDEDDDLDELSPDADEPEDDEYDMFADLDEED